MPQIPYREGGDYPELPTRTPLLVKIIESRFVTEANPFFGKENKEGKVDKRETRDVVKTVMEVIRGDYTGSRIWSNFTASINEKSKLLPFLQAVSDHEMTRAELEAFDTDDLVGERVWVSGSFKPDDTEHKFLKPDSFMRATKEDRAAKMDTPKPAKKAEAEAKPAKKAAAKAPAAQPASTRDAAIAALKAKQAAELAALAGDEPSEGDAGDDGEDPNDTFDPSDAPF